MIAIKDITCYLPETVVTNEQLQRETPKWDMKLIEERTGVRRRHIAGPNETALDLSLKACEKLFLKNGDAKGCVDAIVYCTQTGDHIMPPNSCILHKRLDLPDDVFAFDFNLGCSGYIYGLALSRGLLCSGVAEDVLLVCADTYSKYIHMEDRSTRVLFGDGAAVSWITASETIGRVLDIQCCTSGKYYDKFIIPAGGCRMPRSAATSVLEVDSSGNMRTRENIHMDGMRILTFVKSKVPQQIHQILARNDLVIDDIELFIFHQASRMALDSLRRLLKIGPDRIHVNLSDVGNTVSASIPIALKDAMDKGRVSSGDRVLLCGFGVGLSWGSAIVEM